MNNFPMNSERKILRGQKEDDADAPDDSFLELDEEEEEKFDNCRMNMF